MAKDRPLALFLGPSYPAESVQWTHKQPSSPRCQKITEKMSHSTWGQTVLPGSWLLSISFTRWKMSKFKKFKWDISSNFSTICFLPFLLLFRPKKTLDLEMTMRIMLVKRAAAATLVVVQQWLRYFAFFKEAIESGKYDYFLLDEMPSAKEF